MRFRALPYITPGFSCRVLRLLWAAELGQSGLFKIFLNGWNPHTAYEHVGIVRLWGSWYSVTIIILYYHGAWSIQIQPSLFCSVAMLAQLIDVKIHAIYNIHTHSYWQIHVVVLHMDIQLHVALIHIIFMCLNLFFSTRQVAESPFTPHTQVSARVCTHTQTQQLHTPQLSTYIIYTCTDSTLNCPLPSLGEIVLFGTSVCVCFCKVELLARRRSFLFVKIEFDMTLY